MARTYTYEDFERALLASGLGEQFSAADLELAKKNPDAGMSILSYKQDYNKATTDELRALANAGAEAVRSSFGEYTGGSGGSGYKVTQMSPGSFEYEKSAPEYREKYGDQVNDLMTEILNREDFSYDPETDPMYSSYKKTYTREGNRATADTLGEAAAMTGGIPSSYAVSAASQAGNYYASQLADKVPELYEMAYQKYLGEYQERLDKLQLLQDREQFEYSKYLDELEKYESDRNFNYGKWLDEIESQANERSEAIYKAKEAAEYGDYSLLESLGITPDYNMTERESQGTNAGGYGVIEQTIPESLVAALRQTYPDGIIKDEGRWNELVGQYGEEMLAGNGFAKGNETVITEDLAITMEADLEAMIRLLEMGDEDIKTADDVKNAMIEIYPDYRENEIFVNWLDEAVTQLNANKKKDKTDEEKAIANKIRLESGKLPLNWKER